MMLLPPYAKSAVHSVDDFVNRVLCIDALELLWMLPDNSVDMVLADLPYGENKTKLTWDKILPLQELWKQLKRVIRYDGAIVLTAAQPFTSYLITSNPKMYRYQWYWQKTKGSNFGQAAYQPLRVIEEILVFSHGIATPSVSRHSVHCRYFPIKEKLDKPFVRIERSYHQKINAPSLSSHVHNPIERDTLYEYKTPKNLLYYAMASDPDRGLHPTQKPVALFEYLIRTYTQENEIVLDMTCGSGTTAIACRKTGRRFICGDNSPEYVALANQRLQNTDPFQATVLPDGSRQLSLFEGIA